MNARRLVLACGAVLLAGLLWFGAAAPKPQSPNPDFDAVEQKLDRGGTIYVYLDIENAVNGLLNQFEPLFTLSGDPGAAMVFSIARSAVAPLGLDALDDLGVSLAPLGEGFSRQKVYLRLKERRGLFSLLGGEPRELQALGWMPADSVYAVATELDFPKIIPLAEQVAGLVSGPAGQAGLQAALQSGAQQGVDLRAILASMEGELGAYLRLDSHNIIELPVAPNEVLSFPRPSFAVMAKTKDSSLFQAVAKLSERAGKPGRPISVGPEMEALALPAEQNPFGFQPVIAQGKGRFFFAGDEKELKNALQTPAQGALASAAEFQRLFQGLPSRFNECEFTSRRLAEELTTFLRQAQENMADKNAAAGFGMLIRLLGGDSPAPFGSLRIRVNEPDGVYWITQGAVQTQKMAQSAALAPAGILAAIALPNFLKAQTRSKVGRAKSDMRSMATALEAYRIDWNAYTPHSLDPAQSVLPAQPGGKTISSFRRGGGGVGLTTPIAYITHYLPDPFGPVDGQTFGYYAPVKEKAEGWILFSPGPDSKWDLDWEAYDPSIPQPSPELMAKYAYDPTNGTISGGDLFRVKQ